ncbi:MAG: Disulfide bond formation protein D [SAR116 cluster bacterium MED-G04]|nr:MAG: Disulfide bond formation protein D [SAR116 cluster bacterium MED-G04]
MTRKNTAYSNLNWNFGIDRLNLNRRDFVLGGAAAGAMMMLSSRYSRALDMGKGLEPRIVGNPDAPIHMAEYFSLSCGHCASFHKGTYKTIKKDWIDTGRMRFEYRDFPLQGPAIFAHALARAVPVDAYEGMIDILLAKQKQWTQSQDPVSELAQIARVAGIGRDAFSELIGNRPFLEGIVAIAQQGYDTWGINSTPSFVINDKEVIRGDVGYDEFLDVLNSYSA